MDFSDIQHFRRVVARVAMKVVVGRTDARVAPGTLLPRSGIHRVLICRFVHTLGDALHLTPLIQEIQAIYPGAEIDVLSASPVAREIYSSFFQVRHLYTLPAHVVRHPLRTLRALKSMRRVQYDLVIDNCTESQSGRLLTILANAKYKIGFSGPKKRGNVTCAVAIPQSPTHKAQLPVYLLRRALGVETEREADYPQLSVALTADERRRGAKLLARVIAGQNGGYRNKRILGIFANATGAKAFPIDWWNAFLPVLERQYADHVLIELLSASAESVLGYRYPTYFSSDVRELGSVVAGFSVFVSPDCGVLHLACAVGANTIGLFSVTKIAIWGPYGPANRAIDTIGKTPQQVACEIGGELSFPHVRRSDGKASSDLESFDAEYKTACLP